MQTSATAHLGMPKLHTTETDAATITAIGVDTTIEKQPFQHSNPDHNHRAGLPVHVGQKRPSYRQSGMLKARMRLHMQVRQVCCS
jgi:hypothetical protein